MPQQKTIVQKMDLTLAQLREAQKNGAKKPRLLLHACCAPCSSAVLEFLCDVFDLHIYYYNPNIWPAEEHHRRAGELSEFLKKSHPEISLTLADFTPDDFYAIAKGFENIPERGERCKRCYKLRMEQGAIYAKTHGFDFYTTTLSISPHKNATWINELGEELAEKHGIAHLPSDFKKHGGYARSLEISKEYELYRQQYCGCEFSAKRLQG